uniref:Cytoplasmic dynein 2 light intermediate chain 1 n=1 Tax=Rhabditophanes sp. KR3021 TaxID=114890 RepID=A0AC35TKK7_9BILA
MDIWELAREKIESSKKKPIKDSDEAAPEQDSFLFTIDSKLDSIESHLIIVGSPNCGKTTLINRFLDKKDIVNPTTVLEYSFGYRNRDTKKDVVHIWELSGNASLGSLVKVPFGMHSLQNNIGLFIVLDLTQPNQIWKMFESFINNGIEQIQSLLHKNKRGLKEKLTTTAWQRIGGKEKAENSLVNPFPVPLFIFGAKYDQFQNEDTERRRNIIKGLRILNFLFGGCLIFTSINMENLVTRAKSMMSYVAFNNNYPKGLITDIEKPLFIPFGTDSLDLIGSPNNEGTYYKTNFDEVYNQWRSFFNRVFPPPSLKGKEAESFLHDPKFAEPSIDKLVDEKLYNLERYIKENEEREVVMNRTVRD